MHKKSNAGWGKAGAGRLVMGLALLLCAAGPALALVPPADDKTAGAINNQAAMALYQRLARTPGNLLFSPYSINSALAMAYAGARGRTAEQMRRALWFSGDNAWFHAAFAGLGRAMTAAAQAEGQRLTIANRLWLQQGLGLLPGFLRRVEANYGAGLGQVDFKQPSRAAGEINQWVKNNTGGMIPRLVTAGDVNLATLVITNAVYFQGKWIKPFKEKLTKPGDFWLDAINRKQVPMMRQTGRFRYGEAGAVQLLAMEYRGRGLELLIILPKARTSLPNIEEGLTLDTIDRALSSMRHEKVEVLMPRLNLSSHYLLAKHLAELGMPDAFNAGTADFSGMSGRRDFFIGQVIHKARMELEEEGTKAAAATALVMRDGAAPGPREEPKEFKADHPFLFMIRHRPTGTILFLGRVVDPAG